ncbi:armadillo repeat-containing protein 5 [Microdochium nivale]|nr:armadillo repeat-containing protein 5 [Microdochium nivale]
MASSSGETPVANGNPDVNAQQSQAKSQPLATSTHIIDPRGDLWISASGPGSWGAPISMRMRVCSRALARNSRVFDRMLYGGFAESRGHSVSGGSAEQTWEVELPDDSARAMKQLFEILHCKFLGIFQDDDGHRISIGDKTKVEEGDAAEKDGGQQRQASSFIPHMYDLAVLADKYDCIGVLNFRANAWLGYVHKENLGTRIQLQRAAWLYYQFGDHEAYSLIVERLAMAFPSSSGNFDEGAMVLPPQFLDSVEALRLHMLSKIVAAIESTVSQLISACTEKTAGFCVSSLNSLSVQYKTGARLSCEAELLGVTLRTLYKQQMWPIPDPETLTLSPRSYMISITDKLSVPGPGDAVFKRSSHERCVPKFVLETTELGKSGGRWDQYVPNEEELRFMTQQRKLTRSNFSRETSRRN